MFFKKILIDSKLYTLYRTFAMIKPDAYTAIGKILTMIEKASFVIGNIKMAKFSLQDAQEFYAEHKVNIRKCIKMKKFNLISPFVNIFINWI